MRYETPAAFRQAIEDRLRLRSQDTGQSLDRLRRRVVFERILARLLGAQPGRWVLKGGMALEFRMGDRARATKDLDLIVRHVEPQLDAVVTALSTALAEDLHDDGFQFMIATVRDLAEDEAGRPGWRASIEADLAGRSFATVRIDIVARAEEITGTEMITPLALLEFAELPTPQIEVVDPKQHFAEKVHALTRDYGNRPSSRSRDLADLMILLDDGLQPGEALAHALVHVFRERRTHELPDNLPSPPARWQEEFTRFASELELDQHSLDAAMTRLRSFWERIPLGQKED